VRSGIEVTEKEGVKENIRGFGGRKGELGERVGDVSVVFHVVV